jgi:hypothetical protein
VILTVDLFDYYDFIDGRGFLMYDLHNLKMRQFENLKIKQLAPQTKRN